MLEEEVDEEGVGGGGEYVCQALEADQMENLPQHQLENSITYRIVSLNAKHS